MKLIFLKILTCHCEVSLTFTPTPGTHLHETADYANEHQPELTCFAQVSLFSQSVSDMGTGQQLLCWTPDSTHEEVRYTFVPSVKE